MAYSKQFLCRLNVLILLLAVISFFGIFLQPDYATDSYAEAYSGYSGSAHFLHDGRLITASLSFLFNTIHLNLETIGIISTVAAVLLLAISIFELAKLIKPITKDDKISYLSAFLIIINPFTIELFLYIERGIMALSILFCVFAVKYLIYSFKPYKLQPLLISVLFMLFAVFCYQGTVGLFIVLSITFSFLYPASRSQIIIIIKRILVSGIVYAVPVLCNLIFIRLFSSDTSRTNSKNINLSSNIEQIFIQLKELVTTLGIIPWFIVFLFFVAILAVLIIYFLRRSILKQLIRFVLLLVLVSFISIISAVAPQLFQSFVNLVPRSSYSFGVIFGTIIFISGFFIQKETKGSLVKNAIYMIAVVFLSVMFFRFNSIAISHYNTNAIDRARAFWVNDQIKQYERTSKQTVTYIVGVTDASPTNHYSEIDVCGSGNVSAFSRSWSDVNSINYFTNNKYKSKAANQSQLQYCKSKDWKNLHIEQLKFENDTLLMCNF